MKITKDISGFNSVNYREKKVILQNCAENAFHMQKIMSATVKVANSINISGGALFLCHSAPFVQYLNRIIHIFFHSTRIELLCTDVCRYKRTSSSTLISSYFLLSMLILSVFRTLSRTMFSNRLFLVSIFAFAAMGTISVEVRARIEFLTEYYDFQEVSLAC